MVAFCPSSYSEYYLRIGWIGNLSIAGNKIEKVYKKTSLSPFRQEGGRFLPEF